MAAGRDAPCDPRDGEIGGRNLNEVQNDVISSGLPTPDSCGVCLRRQGGFHGEVRTGALSTRQACQEFPSGSDWRQWRRSESLDFVDVQEVDADVKKRQELASE